MRKYVEKLEVEAKCDEEYLDLVKDKYRSAEARIAELEKRLDDADRVLSPFIQHYESWMDRWPDDEESSTFSRHTFGQLRAARAYMEGK